MDEAAKRARRAAKYRKELIKSTKREIRDLKKVLKGKGPHSPSLRPYLATLEKRLSVLER